MAGRDVIEIHVRTAATSGSPPTCCSPLGTEPARVDAATRRVAVAGRRRHRPAGRRRAACSTSGGIAVDDIGLRRPTLDEVFLALTGGPPAAESRRRPRTDPRLSTETTMTLDHHHHHPARHRRSSTAPTAAPAHG